MEYATEYNLHVSIVQSQKATGYGNNVYGISIFGFRIIS